MRFLPNRRLTCLFLAIVPALSPASAATGFNQGIVTRFWPADRSTVVPLAVNTASVAVVGQTAGPTPFIVQLQLMASQPAALQSIQFNIVPKTGSVTRPLSATYFSDYLQSRGYFNVQTGSITLPVFGLYANYSNTVNLTCCFADGTSQQLSVGIMTPPYSDPCGKDNPTKVLARTNSTDLSYDYIQVKTNCGNPTPIIIDTDGAVRWSGTLTAVSGTASTFFNNAIYISTAPSGSTTATGISRIELDGTSTFLADYSSLGVVYSGHHDMNPGKTGILIEADTTTQIESTILEVDANGNLLKRWNLADIISAAMTAGGDDPTQFVKPAPTDWFHNNAVVYRASDDSLVVSSRENFVIALDYQTGAIKWILGDSTKQWYQFPSLRAYALTLAPYSLPPIGQHAVSFTYDDALLLFDNGKNSSNHTPAGTDRGYSSPRKFRLDLQARTATEVWNYPVGQTLNSQFCSSIYEDSPANYLIDYAIISSLGPQTLAEILGLTPTGNKVFDYRYSTTSCKTSWNSAPVHWENLVFAGPSENLRITAISTNGLNRVFSFPGIASNSYRLEYKYEITDPTWLFLADQTANCSGTTQLADSSGARTDVFYRVRQLPKPSPTPVVPTPVNDSVAGNGINQWEYPAGWSYNSPTSSPAPFQQDEHFATTTNAVAHFRFHGTQVKIYTVKDSAGGNIGYSLDGGTEQIVSNYSLTSVGQALSYNSPAASLGDHDLVIRVVGTHEAAATSNKVTLDKAEVF